MTSKEIVQIKRLHGMGLTDTEISQKIGASLSWTTIWRQKLGLKRNIKTRFHPQKIYYVWRERNDELVAYGTARECARKMGIQLPSFYSEVSRTRSGKHAYYKIMVEDLRGEDCVSPT